MRCITVGTEAAEPHSTRPPKMRRYNAQWRVVMEVDVKLIDDVRQIAVEPPLPALLHDVALRDQQSGWRRQSAGHRFAQHALRGDERRAGKTAKLIDLCARLKCGAL